MDNWYTVGIAFLGGLAVGLLAFLFIQPAETGSDTGNTDKEIAKSSGADEGSSDSETESKSDVESESAQNGNQTNESDSSTSKKEEWEGELDTSSNPHLIFYYKPG